MTRARPGTAPERDTNAPMTRSEFYKARQELGFMWGLDRALTMNEFGNVLRLAGKDPGQSIKDYEDGKTTISGPLSLAVDLLLDGAEPDPPEYWRRDLVNEREPG